jgi:hypothetical protein
LSAYGCVDRHDHARIVVGRSLIPALMWTMAVKVPFVGCQDRAGVLFVVDEDVVGALPAYAAHEPLCVTVRPRRPGWDLHHVDAFGGEYRVERRGELGVPVAMRNRNESARSPKSMTRLRACWVVHSPVGFAVTPRMWTRRVTTSITTRT